MEEIRASMAYAVAGAGGELGCMGALAGGVPGGCFSSGPTSEDDVFN